MSFGRLEWVLSVYGSPLPLAHLSWIIVMVTLLFYAFDALALVGNIQFLLMSTFLF